MPTVPQSTITRLVALPLALAALFSTAAAAPAFVIDRGIHTHDARTGFAWLDLTESVNISYNAMKALLQPGQTFAGYRHATEPEVMALFESAGVQGAPFSQLFLTPSQLAPIRGLQSFVGITTEAGCCGFT